MILKLRERMANREEGFTLIELLVVMLIIGILAAIAIPTFFNQKQKAQDSGSKEMAHTAQVAMETYATDQPTGSYVGVTMAALNTIDKSIALAGTPRISAAAPSGANNTGWTLTITSPTGNTFGVVKDATTGALTYPCTVPAGQDRGGCPSSNFWG